MIIFYEKKTGRIIGTISGRIHPKEHIKMWVGDKDKTERLVVNWVPKKDDPQNFEPKHSQKEIFKKLDKNSSSVYDYKIDLKTKKLIPM
jgi:hypothetical protein